MKAELSHYTETGWEISVEPENEVEECAFEYLADRPKDQLTIHITRFGIFSRRGQKNKEALDDRKSMGN